MNAEQLAEEVQRQMVHFELPACDLTGRDDMPRVRMTDIGGRRCVNCKGVFTLRSFHKLKTGEDGLHVVCKQCAFIEAHNSQVKRGKCDGMVIHNVGRKRLAAVNSSEKLDISREVLEARRSMPKKVERKTWPADKDKRLERVAKIMRQALIDYEGQEAAIASALRLPMVEVMEVIESDEGLMTLYEEQRNYAISRVERQLYNLAMNSNTPTAAMFFLKNARPEKWSDKSQVEVKNMGFTPPPADMERPVSILELVQRKKVEDA